MRFDYLIIAGGKAPSPSYIKRLLKISKKIVTVDGGGTSLLKLNIRPLLHVGDGDSLKPKDLKKLRPLATLKLSSKKNYSDLEFAISQLDESKSKLVVGAHVDADHRPDHSFFNLLLLASTKNLVFADEKNWITRLSPMTSFSFWPSKGTLFSLALLKKSKLWIDGSIYDVKGQDFKYQTQGLSNISRGPRVRVKSKGPALLFVSSDITKTKIDDSLFAR